MSKDLIAKTSITVDAPIDKTWNALVNPEAIKQYMFGTTVVSDWRAGSPIVWKGEWKGKPYEDKGVILTFKPEHTLAYSHFSPLAGKPDAPENYHNVTIELAEHGKQTAITLSQDNNTSDEDRDEAAKTWSMMLAGLKKFLEA